MEWHSAHKAKRNWIKLFLEEWIFYFRLNSGLPLKTKFQSWSWGVSRKNYKYVVYSVTDPSCTGGLAIKFSRTASARLSYCWKISEKAIFQKLLIRLEIKYKVNISCYKHSSAFGLHIDFWLLGKYVYELKEQMSQSSAGGGNFSQTAF